MIHAREDYNRIQDPALQDSNLLGSGCTAIGEDEPVFLLRAKDKLFLSMLREYMDLLDQYAPGTRHDMHELIQKHIDRAVEWQNKYGTKMPDLPK